ncbi:hypothetical protein ACIA8E_32525 [Streptomyces sp. NPDC051664]|uniref:hypothetical protein n=1 Tax=Streptomyces sp. NPDC051664 TaxID=3365668 RepID=UPI0037A25402
MHKQRDRDPTDQHPYQLPSNSSPHADQTTPKEAEMTPAFSHHPRLHRTQADDFGTVRAGSGLRQGVKDGRRGGAVGDAVGV